jgi:hypothetical protein
VFADRISIRFNPNGGEALGMLQSETFAALDLASRTVLSEWLSSAATTADHIDALIELSSRAWKIAAERTIIGVFEKGKDSASWLIIEHQCLWTLARCDNRSVSGSYASLGEVLELLDDALRDV